MIVKLAVAALVLLLLALIVIRFSRTNSVERSIESQHRRLGSMGAVVQRSSERNTNSPRRSPAIARKLPVTHVVPEELIVPSDSPPEAPAIDDRPRSPEGRLVFGDLSITPVKPPTPPIYEPRARRPRPTRSIRKGEHFRRTDGGKRTQIIGASAISAAIILSGGGYLLFHRHPKVPAVTAPVAHHPAHSQSVKTSQPKAGSLVSSTPTIATFVAPKGSYRVTVTVSGPCWMGFSHQASYSGPWLATPTVGVGGVPNYTIDTHGPLAIDVGAPSALTSVEVNGEPVRLPVHSSPSFEIFFRA